MTKNFFACHHGARIEFSSIHKGYRYVRIDREMLEILL